MNRKRNGFTTAKLVIAIAVIVIAVIAILVTVLIPRGHTHTPSAELTVVKTPTCTTPGVAHTLCTDCGEILEEVTLPATGKHIGEPIPEIPATCTSTGLTAGEKCVDCGAILVAQQEIPVLAHTYDDKYDANCNVCDHTRDVDCRHNNVETLKKVEPTCTAAGKTEGKKCKTCGEVLTAQTLIEKLPHTYSKAVTAPTCAEKGYTTYTCTCSDSYVADYVNATGEHIYDDQYDATCNTCDHVRVAACRHDDVETLKKVEPTCTAAGKTEGKKCKTCGEVLTAQTLIEKLPHTYSKAVTAPTCAEKGYTTYTCACGDSYVADYVNATGKHNYVDGRCTHCGAEDPDPGRKAMREAEKAYADYKTKNGGKAPEYMLYQSGNRFVALHKGTAVGVFARAEDVVSALVGEDALYYQQLKISENLFSLQYEARVIALRYDDRYDVSGKTVEIINAGTPTSKKVGTGVAAGTLDDAVITKDGDKLIATGIGTAQVSIDDVVYEVKVTAAPISLFLLIGQSNMRGSEGDPNQSIVCPDGMVYSTYGDDRGAENIQLSVNTARQFVASSLTGQGSNVNITGTTTGVDKYPIYMLTEAGIGKMGMDSGIAYEWVQQTGEKVWVVNAAHGGVSITNYQKDRIEYEEAKSLFTACQETLQKEIAAGHYTLSHMGYFWCQGCAETTWTAEQYVKSYLAMHENLKKDLAFDHDSNADSPKRTIEFAGIIPIRSGYDYRTSYRQDTYATTTDKNYYESFLDLRLSGPRVAQIWMGNNPELPDIWNVCNIGDDWVWMPDGTNGVAASFQSRYPDGKVDYPTQIEQGDSWRTPTTPNAVHDTIHYNQIGYNELGREAARNMLIILGEIEAPEVTTSIKFLSWDGFTEVDEVTASTTGNSGTIVVPKIYPLWNAKNVTFTLTEGLTYSYYDLLTANRGVSGTMSVTGAETIKISVNKELPGLHFSAHLSQLPDNISKDVNLWQILEHDKYYFNGSKWAIYSADSRKVCSVTIPVNPGDKIYATSFDNGGIRCTFFSDYGVAKTMIPNETYSEFKNNGGYLIAPEGAVAINIVMWNDSDENEIYIIP